jgi:hypothetical protein
MPISSASLYSLSPSPLLLSMLIYSAESTHYPHSTPLAPTPIYSHYPARFPALASLIPTDLMSAEEIRISCAGAP